MELSKLLLDVVMGDESVVKMAVSSCIGRLSIATLKAAQAEAIVEILKGHDVLLACMENLVLPFCVAKILHGCSG